MFAFECVNGIGFFGDLFFCVGHWLLAMYYYETSTKTPNQKNQGGRDLKMYNIVWSIGLILNIFAPLLEVACTIWAYYDIDVKKETATQP